MTADIEKRAAAAAKRLAVKLAYSEFLRQENVRASDAAAILFAKRAAAAKIAHVPEWSIWHFFLLVTGRGLPPE
jgi:hypothetical protein